MLHYSAFIHMVYSPAITPGSKDGSLVVVVPGSKDVVVSKGAFAGKENLTTSMLLLVIFHYAFCIVGDTFVEEDVP